jgi:hypothetical protein
MGKVMTLCLRPWILFGGGARLRRARREVFGKDQPELTFRGRVAEQTAKASEINSTRGMRQGWILLAQAANPTEQMRIAAQLREAVEVGKIGLEIGQEAIGGHSVVPVGTPEHLNLGSQDLLQVLGSTSRLWAWSHRSCGTDRRVRFPTARAYSRHTSWGAI